MDTRKEQERAELHRAIWKIANGLRGSVDGWDFKQYVLGMLFYRYISENLAAYVAQGEAEGFDYAALSDAEAETARVGIVQEKGFFIPPSSLFRNVHAHAARDENLNETLAAVFRGIEASALGQESETRFKTSSSLGAGESIGTPKQPASAATTASERATSARRVRFIGPPRTRSRHVPIVATSARSSRLAWLLVPRASSGQ